MFFVENFLFFYFAILVFACLSVGYPMDCGWMQGRYIDLSLMFGYIKCIMVVNSSVNERKTYRNRK